MIDITIYGLIAFFTAGVCYVLGYLRGMKYPQPIIDRLRNELLVLREGLAADKTPDHDQR